ncbi:MAG: glycerol-3-phosphate dehydrogenase/oxidase [Planctomyces sp.]|nr:glycerol-3-phosphate dehydrogenase/oxidase [Planctomyces sp.]
MQRKEMLNALDANSDDWDIVIVGGGATGLGAAVEAVTRGHRTVLLEANDFSSGTSSRSTKLIHGGVRYLQKGQIGMVRQSLRERGRLLRNAPHLVHLLDFVVPTYELGSRWYYYAGLRLYDSLAGSLSSCRTSLLSSGEVQERLPTIRTDRLKGGVLYQDGQFDDSRLAVCLARTAARYGAVVVNHSPVTRLIQEQGHIRGVIASDRESGREYEVRAKMVINATGIFADSVMAMDQEKPLKGSGQPLVTPSQGSHLVLDGSFLPGNAAVMVPKTDDGRVLFIIPWLGRVLIGTTDVEKSVICDDPHPGPDEVQYLLDHAGRYLTRPPQYSDVLSMFTGMRPLVRGDRSQSTAQLSREHEIRISDSGLMTVVGGKWTTYRQMGEELIDRVEAAVGLKKRPSITAELSLTDPAADLKVVEWMTDHPDWADVVTPGLPYRQADLVRAVRLEMAGSVEDVLARRTRFLFLDAAAAKRVAVRTAELLRVELRMSDQWAAQQVADFQAVADSYLRPVNKQGAGR